MKSIKLQDIIEAIEIQMDEFFYHLNTETSEIICFSSEDLRIAEDSEENDDFAKYPDWQRDSIMEALDVLTNWDNRKYIELPTKFDINEYIMIEAFSYSMEDAGIRNKLCFVIHGSDAFRRFKDALYRYGVEDLWYKFRDEAYEKLAVEWCERNKVPYIR